MMSKGFAGVDIANMYFHHGQRSNSLDGIVEGDGGVGVSPRIQYHTLYSFLLRLVERVDECTLVVGLEGHDMGAVGKALAQTFEKVVERGGTIDRRLATAQEVEVRAVED